MNDICHVKVSGIMLVYNQLSFVEDALRSAMAQTYPFDELIVSDDASTDGTWEALPNIIQKLQRETGYEGRIVLRQNEKNLGISRHFDIVARSAANQLLVGLAGDDLSLPDRVLEIVKDYHKAGKPQYYLSHSPAYILDSDEIFYPPVKFNSTLEEIADSVALHIGATQAFTKSLIIDFPPLGAGLFEDLILGFRASLFNHYRYIEKPLIKYRTGGASFKKKTLTQLWEHKKNHLEARLKDCIHINNHDLTARLLQLYVNHLDQGRRIGLIHEKLPPQIEHYLIQQWTNDLASHNPIHDKNKNNDFQPIHVYIRITENTKSESYLQKTITSIEQQTVKPASILTGATCWPEADTDGWVWLLEAGDILHPSAIEIAQSHLTSACRQHPNACFLYTDHAVQAESEPDCYIHPILKPAPQRDLALSSCYTGRSVCVKSDWARTLAHPPLSEPSLAFTYKLLLEATSPNKLQENAILHIDAPLWYAHPRSEHLFAHHSETWQRMAHHLHDHANGALSEISPGPIPGTFHYRFNLKDAPSVTIIIPTHNQFKFIAHCIEQILSYTNYPNYHILVVDNDNDEPQARQFLDGLKYAAPDKISVMQYSGAFNYAKIMNIATQNVSSYFLLFLNDDVYPTDSFWLANMVANGLRDEVGIVGAHLRFPDDRIQHAGVVLGLKGPAGHVAGLRNQDELGYMGRQQLQQNFSAVTAACMLIKRELFIEVGGFDPDTFAVLYNDIDLCLKVKQKNKLIVWCPHAKLVHEQSQSLTSEPLTPSRVERAKKESNAFLEKWRHFIQSDPAYHRCLSLQQNGYELEYNLTLTRPPRTEQTVNRILAFRADFYGCGQYRIVQPAKTIKQYLHEDIELCDEILRPYAVIRSDATHLIFQRPVSDLALAALEELLQLNNVGKVFEIDDLLDRLPFKSAHRKHMPQDIRQRLIKAMKRCDRLIVSTDTLAELYGKFCKDVRVMPNYLTTILWGAEPFSRIQPDNQRPKIGWAGGISHQGDLEMLEPLFKKWANQVDFVFFGYCPDTLKKYAKEIHSGVSVQAYPKKLAELACEWDLAIAPLEDNMFNRCKTALKLLEYGWCGLPVLCSNVGPYQDKNFPVIRVNNKFSEWDKALQMLLSDKDHTFQLGLELQRHVQNYWTFTPDIAQNWLQAWTLQ